MATEEPKFSLYVSSVEGRLVSRYGAGARGVANYIGARRDNREPSAIIWDAELIVALTAAEVARFGREYDRTLESKALRLRTREDWLAQTERERAAAKPAPPDAEPEAPAEPAPTAPPKP